MQAPFLLGGAPGVSRALPILRGARLRLSTGPRQAGVRDAAEGCPITGTGHGQEARSPDGDLVLTPVTQIREQGRQEPSCQG